MAGEFWFDDRQWAVLEPLLPKGQPGARRVDDRRVLSGIVHVLRTGSCARGPAHGLPLAGLPADLWAADHGLQPLPPLVPPWAVAEAAAGLDRGGAGRGSAARQHQHEGAPLGRRRKRGAQAQAIGRSRGGRTTIERSALDPSAQQRGAEAPRGIHAVVDGRGRPLAFALTPGQRGDAPVASLLLLALPAGRCCVADAAYDSNGLRRMLLDQGTLPVIPNNPTRKRRHPFDPATYRMRNLIERAFCRLKDWRRIATRYDKLAANYAAAVAIAIAVTWWI